jgi:hypothetical protein
MTKRKVVPQGATAKARPPTPVTISFGVPIEAGAKAATHTNIPVEHEAGTSTLGGLPAERTTGLTVDVNVPVESKARRQFRDNDDAEALMTEWMENFLAAKGRPAKCAEAHNEWERRFKGPDGKPVRGDPSFKKWWWALPDHLKLDPGRPGVE